MTRLALCLIASLVAASHGFAPAPGVVRMGTSLAPPPTALRLMTQEETDHLMKRATSCVDGECSLDDVGDLLELLKAQQQQLSDRLDEVRSMIGSLEHVNGQDDRRVDDVRETIRALYRVFQLGSQASGNDYPSLSRPTGYSGDVGKGPTDAYTALKPKPWKAPA